jgi:hypothetical protein
MGRGKMVIKKLALLFMKGIYPIERIRAYTCYLSGITTDKRIKLKNMYFLNILKECILAVIV